MRVTLVTLLGLAIVLTSAGAFVYLTMRQAFERSLDETLAARAEIARNLAAIDPDARSLANSLEAVGVPARVIGTSGALVESEPASPRLGSGPAPGTVPLEPPLVERAFGLPDGRQVVVLASRAGVDRTLRRLVAVEITGLLGAFLMAIGVLYRAYAVALRPVDRIAEVAHQLVVDHAPGATSGDETAPTAIGRIRVAVDDLASALESALERARSADLQRRRFLDDASHHLRTPVAALRAVVESLTLNDDEQQRERLMAMLLRETARAARVTGMLLRLARLDAGEPLLAVATDVDALCRDEVSRAAATRPDLALEIRGAEVGHRVVDQDALREILGHLLSNAIAHADARVDVAVVVDGNVLTLAVHDDGGGLPPGTEDVAFERFATWGDGPGAGLGLALVRGLARAHGGDAVYSGGSFVVKLREGGAAQLQTVRAGLG